MSQLAIGPVAAASGTIPQTRRATPSKVAQISETTPIEYLLSQPRGVIDAYESPKAELEIAQCLKNFVDAKNYDPKLVERLLSERVFLHLLQAFLLKAPTHDQRIGAMDWDLFGMEHNLQGVFHDQISLPEIVWQKYNGAREQNQRIDRAIRDSVIRSPEQNRDFPERQCNGYGAATCFDYAPLKQMWGGTLKHERDILLNTPIVILGAGPAGLMATRMLVEIGFNPKMITVIDKSGQYKGIWNRQYAREADMNNPRKVDFLGKILEPAPGPGQRIYNFLHEIETGFHTSLPQPRQARVVEIKPGNYDHLVTIEDTRGQRTTLRAPIVINAIGVGPAKELNTGAEQGHGIQHGRAVRKQMLLTKQAAELLRGKNVVIMGFGNSAIEMLRQIQALNDRGFNIGYKVLTNYPALALSNPETSIPYQGKEVRFYRDVGNAILTKVSGDLEPTRKVFDRAKKEGCVYTDVDLARTHSVDSKTLKICFNDGTQQQIPCNKVFQLIGYKHTKETLTPMGISVDEDDCPLYDYDGEFHRPSHEQESKGRTYKGYSGIGAILANPSDQNAFVMPGIMHRMPWLVFNVLIRAFEALSRDKTSVII